jgi:hypothetical protein
MRARSVASILAVISTMPALADPPQPAPLSVDGMGWLQVGMSEPDLLKHFDPVDDHAKRDKWWKQCHLWKSKSWAGLAVMVEDGQLVRLSISGDKGPGGEQSRQVKTEEGIALGASEAQVLAAYADIRRDAAPPNDPDRTTDDLYYQPRGSAGRGFRFDLDASRHVAGIYAGGPQIGYSENCE